MIRNECAHQHDAHGLTADETAILKRTGSARTGPQAQLRQKRRGLVLVVGESGGGVGDQCRISRAGGHRPVSA